MSVSNSNEVAENWITPEVARFLRVPEATCRYWRHIGYGPRSFKAGRRVLYARADVLAWLEAAKASESVSIPTNGSAA